MQRFFRIFLSLTLAVITAFSMIALPSSAAAAKLNRTSVIVAKGYTAALKVSGASRVSWSSDNESVATVTQKGVVKGLDTGTATVSADTGKTVLKCKVSVRAGKITASANKVYVEKGSYSSVSVKALGTHDIKVSSSDESVAKAGITGSFSDNNVCKLNISGINDGTARIKIYSKEYPKSVYMNIDVTVGLGKPVEATTRSGVTASVNLIEINENLSESFTVRSSDIALADIRILSTNKNCFDVEYSVNVEKNAIDVKVKGFVEGEGNIRIDSGKGSSFKIMIPVKVTNNTYDVVVWNRSPRKRAYSDIIYTITDGSGRSYYILEPKDADIAHAASLLAKAADTFEYYTVYETVPKNIKNNDETIVKAVNYKGERVVRYLLAEKGYDPAITDTLFAQYCGEFEYNVVYAVRPDVRESDDAVLVYEYIPFGKEKAEKRYILIDDSEYPGNADKAWEEYLKNRENVTVL